MARKAASQAERRGGRAKSRRRSKTPAIARRRAVAGNARAGNPLLEAWSGPFELPPFDRLHSAHFLPAFDRALAQNLSEVAGIANQRTPPTFANTIEALERSGR